MFEDQLSNAFGYTTCFPLSEDIVSIPHIVPWLALKVNACIRETCFTPMFASLTTSQQGAPLDNVYEMHCVCVYILCKVQVCKCMLCHVQHCFNEGTFSACQPTYFKQTYLVYSAHWTHGFQSHMQESFFHWEQLLSNAKALYACKQAVSTTMLAPMAR